ncbi:hypothetical protein UFOVP931_38 [uncultured Caudovirales phage]|jgi:hypothetical protein|uniref:Uncharacterized protein n=1 Tax=uncultured Caudovirales phage TaxID=2100421 RepID=A0A6J5PSJ2_9CAUD|nr:hypothetical protein UFOVP931_38 [uncultured Caudovirales phage]CAB4200316.1 hypothetical protein UFOVP1358_44 [uncultured Caudovirales phage]
MRKKPKTVQVGSHEYFNALLTYYTNRSTAIMRSRGNLSREDLEYLAEAASKLKDKRLQECIAELIGWGDDERSELETLLAIGFEAMKLCSPSRLREAAMRVSLKYYMKKEFSHAQESIDQSDGRVSGAEATAGHSGQGVEVQSATMPGSVPGQGHPAD